MLTSIILIAVFLILIWLGAYFGGAETAFTAMNIIKIKALADGGNKQARAALYINNNFDRALATILIGNNITHIGAGAVATTLVLHLWDHGNGVLGHISENTASFLYGTVIATFLVFLFAEMIPKSKANDCAEELALRYSLSMRLIMKILYPLAVFFGWISKTVSKKFAGPETPSITEDELYTIIDTAAEEGVMDEAQSDILKSVLRFSDTCVSDVMTMREEISCADVNQSASELVETIKRSNHSRIPVYDGSEDKIIGILNIRSFLKAYLKNPKLNVRKNLSQPFFVSPDDPIDDLFTVMSNEKRYMAVVGTPEKFIGLVTIEDFLEELVGEIWDEDDVVDNRFMKLGGNRFLVDTELQLGEVFRRMGLRLPEKRLHTKSVLSWLNESFGHLPGEGEVMVFHNIEVSVKDIEDNVIKSEEGRVDKVVFRIMSSGTPAPSKEASE